ncbi:hypothetical protein [Burkholderia territorii]|uniref:hypothetical protein n=1 Tax=Burkholderia territorii TaxID=1503055 RepID=UPI000AF8015E|nr:hypothetical protein [Burkholderia territorii]
MDGTSEESCTPSTSLPQATPEIKDHYPITKKRFISNPKPRNVWPVEVQARIYLFFGFFMDIFNIQYRMVDIEKQIASRTRIQTLAIRDQSFSTSAPATYRHLAFALAIENA